MEDIVHGCCYFENDAEFYWEPVKLFEGRGDDTDIANRIMNFVGFLDGVLPHGSKSTVAIVTIVT